MKIAVLLYLLKIVKRQNSLISTVFLSKSVRNFLICTWVFLCCSGYAQNPILERKITIPKQQTTLYDALNQISVRAECFFVYDSKVIESDKKVRVGATNQKVSIVLDDLLNDKSLDYRVIGNHILILKREAATNKKITVSNNVALGTTEKMLIVVRGRVLDENSRLPLAYATVTLGNTNIGTIANSDGFFLLKLPDSLRNSILLISHMGYMSRQIPLEILEQQSADVFLARRIISMQEVVIRYLDPLVILSRALTNRKLNYSAEPVYMNTFYREGVQKNSRFVSYSEGVFKIYKSTFLQPENADQVKILKSRRVLNSNPNDSVFVKLKAGIQSALLLDIIKNCPDFLDPEHQSDYDFFYADITPYNTREAYVVNFKPKSSIEEPLYMGTLYIDNENFAILGAEFEIDTKYIDKAADNFIIKKSRKLNVKLLKIRYSVSYASSAGKYHLNHVRCEISLKTRMRNHLGADVFNTFLELAVFQVDTMKVQKFLRQELIKPQVIFSDIGALYDEQFWGDLNYILPEEKLSDALARIKGK